MRLAGMNLPFIGGVPISIDRLRRGLEALGNRVLVVAPRYGKQVESEELLSRAHAGFRAPHLYRQRQHRRRDGLVR